MANITLEKTKESFDNWFQNAVKGETIKYHTGFFCIDVSGDYRMAQFGNHMMNFESKTKQIVLFQKKIQNLIYEYYVQKV